MSVTESDLQRVAALARLGLEPDRVRMLVEEVNGILSHMEELRAVDTSAVENGEDGILSPRLRPDVPRGEAPLDPASFAPRFADGFFLVPRLASHDGG